jgi:hypothetical protein
VDWGVGVDWGIVPVKKPVLGQQSRTSWLENQLGLSQSLCDVGCVASFTARLSKQQPWLLL